MFQQSSVAASLFSNVLAGCLGWQKACDHCARGICLGQFVSRSAAAAVCWWQVKIWRLLYSSDRSWPTRAHPREAIRITANPGTHVLCHPAVFWTEAFMSLEFMQLQFDRYQFIDWNNWGMWVFHFQALEVYQNQHQQPPSKTCRH